MALNTFGWTPSEVTTDSAGNVISGVTLTVFTDVTKATQVTTLFDKDGTTALASGVVVSDNKGRFGFKASDAYSMLYVYDGSTADPWPIAAHEALDQGMASHAQAVADAQAAADSAAASAALVNAPADTAIATAINSAGTQTRSALNNTFARPAANTVVIFGDSITAQNGSGPGTLAVTPITDPSTIVSGRGYWIWANSYLGQRARLVYNAGIGGNTSAQMRARIQTDVLAYASDWVVVCAGANDVAQDRTLADTTADMGYILDTLLAAGRKVVLLTAPPSVNYNTSARRAVLSGLNKWIREQSRDRKNVAVVDVWRVLADPATGSPATGMAVDGIHPTEAGAQRMGKAIADVLDPLMPRTPSRTLGLLDADNVIGNPHFGTGTGWNLLGSGVAASYVAAEDRWASKAVLTLSGITDNTEHGIQYIEPITNGRYAIGDVVQATARFKWSGATTPTLTTGTFRPFIRIWPRRADNSFADPAYTMFTASAQQAQPVGNQITSGDIVASTFRLTVPVNTANLYVAFGWQGMAAGTLEVSDVAVYKNA